MMSQEKLLESIRTFPTTCGVYLMKDSSGKFLYIGKALNLRNRVRSYFFDTHADRSHIPYMVQKIDSIEWIATNTEAEALILEANLIREYRPPYNIDLKDDKHYPYLKVTVNEPFPRLLVVRRVFNDGALYFGPYTDARAVRMLQNFARKVFKIRNCSRALPLDRPVRPCIRYGMHHCSGVCAGKMSQTSYMNNVAMLIQFIKGNRKEIITELEKRMNESSEKLEFEAAAGFRDQILLVQNATYFQKVDLKAPDKDCDVFGIAYHENHVCLCILFFRQGVLLSKRHFEFSKKAWQSSYTDLEPVIIHFYQSTATHSPAEIILPADNTFNSELLSLWFNQQYHRKITVTTPVKGLKAQLVLLAEKNASLYLSQKAGTYAESTLNNLQKACNLPRFPRTIEAFDISNLAESFAVAGMVHYENGVAVKSKYRRFKIKTVAGQNDFAMIMEAVSRQLKRLEKENKSFPDLLLIDGGKGQLKAAAEALRQFCTPPMLIALAKKEETIHTPYLPAPVSLPSNNWERRLLERIRDEVHRWALAYHTTLRDKQYRTSSLESIPGVGTKRARALLKHFGSLKRIQQSTVEEIAKVEGLSIKSAENLLKIIQQLWSIS